GISCGIRYDISARPIYARKVRCDFSPQLILERDLNSHWVCEFERLQLTPSLHAALDPRTDEFLGFFWMHHDPRKKTASLLDHRSLAANRLKSPVLVAPPPPVVEVIFHNCRPPFRERWL